MWNLIRIAVTQAVATIPALLAAFLVPPVIKHYEWQFDDFEIVKVQLAVIAGGWVIVVALTVYDNWFVIFRLPEFRIEYFTEKLNPIRQQLADDIGPPDGAGVRINVMIPRRSLRSWGLRAFHFCYRAGFADGQHPDAGLCLFKGQGVASIAYERMTPVVWYRHNPDHPSPHGLSWLFRGPEFGLTKKQRSRTRHVHWILSVPLIKDRGHEHAPTILGVVNLDVTNKAAAARLHGNPAYVAQLIRQLCTAATLAAKVF